MKLRRVYGMSLSGELKKLHTGYWLNLSFANLC